MVDPTPDTPDNIHDFGLYGGAKVKVWLAERDARIAELHDELTEQRTAYIARIERLEEKLTDALKRLGDDNIEMQVNFDD